MPKIPANRRFFRTIREALPTAATVQAPVHDLESAKPVANHSPLALTSALPIRSPSMTSFARHRSSPRLAAALLLLLAAALAGCGSNHTSGSSADPASLVPASTRLYVGATVRPDGVLKTDALVAGGKLTHRSDPYLRLLPILQTPGSPTLDFSRDVAPWLGARAGIFLDSLDSSGQLLSQLLQGLLGGPSSTSSASPFAAKDGAHGAIVLDTRDDAKARSFIASHAQRAGAHMVSYRGVSYYLASSSNIALGVVDHLAAIGSEAGLHGVIDSSLGGPSLARSAGYTKLLANGPSGALAHAYTHPGVATALGLSGSGATGTASGSTAAAGSGDASQSGAPGFSSLLALLAGTREADLSLLPSPTSFAIDADTLSSGSATHTGGLLSSGPAGVRTLGELPGESWLAIGFGEVGASLGGDVQSLGELLSLGSSAGAAGPPESATSGGFTVQGVIKGIVTPLDALSANNAEAKRAFQSWMGPSGLFASGSGVVNLRAGIVIVSHNPSGSHAAVAKLAGLLNKGNNSAQTVSIPGTDAAISARVSGLPVELDIADGRAANGQTEFVIGVGEASVQDALHPSSTLAGSAALGAGASALGEGVQPSLFVDFPQLVGLLEGVGLNEDPTISGLLPDLRTLTTLAGGGHSLGGGIERTRIVAGL
jgi:hypothetical protein